MKRTPTVILGLCSYTHDSSAALLVDGELVGFVEEERLSEQKHTKLYPARAVGWLLDQAKLSAAWMESALADPDGGHARWMARHLGDVALRTAREGERTVVFGDLAVRTGLQNLQVEPSGGVIGPVKPETAPSLPVGTRASAHVLLEHDPTEWVSKVLDEYVVVRPELRREGEPEPVGIGVFREARHVEPVGSGTEDQQTT